MGLLDEDVPVLLLLKRLFQQHPAQLVSLLAELIKLRLERGTVSCSLCLPMNPPVRTTVL